MDAIESDSVCWNIRGIGGLFPMGMHVPGSFPVQGLVGIVGGLGG